MLGFRACRALLLAHVVGLCALWPATGQMNIDGGRGDLPGMKQDMFDRVQRNKKASQQKGKAPPECPKSDKMSPFFSLAFASNEMYVRLNGTEGQCQRLISVGGANYTELINASKTCGPAGEWKKRIAEELSAVFFQGGLEWVRNENDTIEVITDEGTFQVEVSEARYAVMEQCWTRSCGCEQANNPMSRLAMMALLVIAVGGLGFDSFKLLLDKVRGKKPAKHVMCKKGHKMEEVKFASRNYCDICSTAGTTYQCSVSCNYDLCKICYKAAKKKVKTELGAWLEKHPNDPDNKEKKKKKEKDKDGSDKEEEEKSGAEASGAEDERTEPESSQAEGKDSEGKESEKSEVGDGDGKSETEVESAESTEKPTAESRVA